MEQGFAGVNLLEWARTGIPDTAIARVIHSQNILRGSMYELTAKELEIVVLIAEGLSNFEIAQRLNCSIKTVDYHNCSIFRTLDCRSRKQITAMYQEDSSQFVLRKIPTLADAIVDLYQQGVKANQIAARLDSSVQYTYRVIRAHTRKVSNDTPSAIASLPAVAKELHPCDS